MNSKSSTTTRGEFIRLAHNHRVVPVIRKLLADGETPLTVYRKLAADQPGTFLLESAAPGQSWSRYSFIGAGSSSAVVVNDGIVQWIGQPPADIPLDQNPYVALKDILSALHTEQISGLPPLTSGLVGYMGHDMVRYIENIPDSNINDLKVPDMVQLLVGDLAVLDHHEGVIWLISNAINWNNTDCNAAAAYDRAVAALDTMTDKLAEVTPFTLSSFANATPEIRRQRTQEEHFSRIERAKEYIKAGDAFQIVVSQRFEVDTDVPGIDIYRMLRVSNPSPYMYLLNIPTHDFGDTAFQIIGSSPESLVTVKDQHITSFPIAGSRPRGETLTQDDQLEAELYADEKENAEHLMLVDLARNDIGRVAIPGTVEVHEFRHVEKYSHIMHLVSTVSGLLAPDKDAVDAFIATFPAGTLSGAPKPRALAIIDELEDSRRGIYGGTVGYFDLAGNTDQAIAIRTGLYKEGTVYVQAGGGIVADSELLPEDIETQNKAAAVLRAIAAASTMEKI